MDNKNNLKEEIEKLLNEIKTTHIYKSSIIYQLYNQAYNKNDKPSTCGSCVKTRAQLLQRWLDNYYINLPTPTTPTVEEPKEEVIEEPEQTKEPETIETTKPIKKGRTKKEE